MKHMLLEEEENEKEREKYSIMWPKWATMQKRAVAGT